MEIWLASILIVLALIVGIALGILGALYIIKRTKLNAQTKAEKLVKDAKIKSEQIVKNAELDAKQQIFDLKQEAEKEIKERKQELSQVENKLLQREQTIDARDNQLLRKEQSLEDKEKNVEKITEEVKKKNEFLTSKVNALIEELEKVAKMSEKEAREKIFENVKEKEALNIAKYLKEEEEKAESQAEDKAKEILALALERQAQETTTERSINVISLPNDEMKGRIIGREGRNIKSLEQQLGVDILIDDTPETITISCFNPIRREIASRALNALIKDGRIQPGRIEEVIEKCKKDVDQIIKKAGEEAVFKLGLTGFHKDIINYLGRLRFRTSYGQNQLEHSVEVANLCGVMAAELGLDQNLAKRAGLLHDLGKAIDFEMDGSHVELGARFAKKCGEKDIVVNAIEAHHGDVPCNSVIAHIVIAADTLSAARPGARSETLETYVRRLEQLEGICNSYDSVQNSYAIQSGREVRVIVLPDKIDDLGAFKLAKDIKDRIEAEMKYPGQIKVNVIREYRAQEIAK